MTVTIEPMTKEDIDDLFAEADLIAKMAGFKNHHAMENFKINASLGLIQFGGSFAKPLGHALAHADVHNTFKIISTFREMCKEHADLYIKFMKNRDEAQY